MGTCQVVSSDGNDNATKNKLHGAAKTKTHGAAAVEMQDALSEELW